MRKIAPVIIFMLLVLIFPHGIAESISLVGVLITGGIALWQTMME